ncbi:hypothetical protein NFJ02_21g45270 [Pycnococcus provasolii]
MPDPVKMDVTENALQEDFPSSPCHGEDDARGGGGGLGGGGGGPTPPKTENNVTMDMDADPPVMTISEAVASASAAALHRLMESYTTQLSKLDTETQAVSKKAREATFKRTQQNTNEVDEDARKQYAAWLALCARQVLATRKLRKTVEAQLKVAEKTFDDAVGALKKHKPEEAAKLADVVETDNPEVLPPDVLPAGNKRRRAAELNDLDILPSSKRGTASVKLDDDAKKQRKNAAAGNTAKGRGNAAAAASGGGGRGAGAGGGGRGAGAGGGRGGGRGGRGGAAAGNTDSMRKALKALGSDADVGARADPSGLLGKKASLYYEGDGWCDGMTFTAYDTDGVYGHPSMYHLFSESHAWGEWLRINEIKEEFRNGSLKFEDGEKPEGFERRGGGGRGGRPPKRRD